MYEFLIKRCNCLGSVEYYLWVKFCILLMTWTYMKIYLLDHLKQEDWKSRQGIARMILLIMHGHVTVFPLIEAAAYIKSSTFNCWNWQRMLLLTNSIILCNKWYFPFEFYSFTLTTFHKRVYFICSVWLLLEGGFY